MFVADLSIKRPILMSMFLVVFLIFGSLMYFNLPLELTPNVSIGVVTIQTTYPGAGPREVETQITKPIEDAVATISQIDFIKSYSMNSFSIITIMFDLQKNPDLAVSEVKDKVDGVINLLPQNSERPTVQKLEMNAKPVMDIIFSGPLSGVELYEYADKNLKDRFSQVEGVARVDLVGGQKREIQIRLDNRQVFDSRISLSRLAQILAAQNMDLPAGRFRKEDQEYSLRFNGKIAKLQQLEELEIPTVFGYKPLNSLAQIVDGGEEIRERATFFNAQDRTRNDNLVLISLVKSSDGNAVDLAQNAMEELKIITRDLPEGCSLSIVKDNSIFVQGAVLDTLNNVFMGVALTALVLLFFLHDLRAMIIAALAMPFSIISTFLLLRLSGFSLNLMTLMGLSTSVGVLVTNSVVVLENIFRYRRMGEGARTSASKGTSEIMLAVLASTLTNIMVFLPIASMSSIVGKFFKQFALTVTFATIFSLLVSFTLTPMLAALILKEKQHKKHPIGEALEKVFARWAAAYGRILKKAIKSRKASFLVLLLAGILLLLSLSSARRIGFEFMPLLDEGDIAMEVELPGGTNLQQTLLKCSEIEEKVTAFPQVKHVLMEVGKLSALDRGVHLAKIQIKLIDATRRKESSQQMANTFIKTLSGVTNVALRINAVSSVNQGSGEAPIQFYLRGQDDLQLNMLKNQIVALLQDIPELVNFNNSAKTGQPELVIRPDRRKLTESGLTAYDIALAVRGSVDGLKASQYEESGEKYDIRLILSDDSVDSPEKIAALGIVNPSTFSVYRLGDLARVTLEESQSKILHKDKVKSIQFDGHPALGIPLGNVVGIMQDKLSELKLPDGYQIEWSGSFKIMKEAIADMGFTFILALILTYMLLAAILESLTQPLMILGTVPLALIGVFWAMDISGLTMNIMSMMAIVMLVGIVVNNAILLLEYTNLLRTRGKTVPDALLEACPARLQPILMSTIAIILGMLPMAMGIGEAGREFRQPMGVVSIGGLLVSGILTLLVIPAVTNLFSGRNEKKLEHSDD